MPSQWLDFKALKAQLKIIDILNHHGVKLKFRGAQGSGFCPLPGHEDGKSPSFSVNLERHCFNCFGCGKAGNAMDLELMLQGLDPNDTQAVRRVALELAQRHHLNVGSKGSRNGQATKRSRFRSDRLRPTDRTSVQSPTDAPSAAEDATKDGGDESTSEPNEIVNAPLGFMLHELDANHPYLLERGFTPATIEHFGLGFCSKGMLKDRIAIPLHNEIGTIVGYAGRAVDDQKVSTEHPKYLFPGRREKARQVFAFRKSMLLYNANRIEVPSESLIIVEGFTSVWWLWQNGIRNVVALMGSSASQWQIGRVAALTAEKGKLFVFPDGDEAGVQLARELLPQLAARRWTTWAKLLADEQPTDLDGDMLNALLMP